MDHSVQFEDEEDLDRLAIPEPKPVTISDMLLSMRLVNSPGEAMMLVGIFVSLLIGASIYLLASSVHGDPTLPDEAAMEERKLAQ
jgi:hypothetical protein